VKTIVLNADFTYLNTVSWRRGIKLMLKEKAIVVKNAEQVISNSDKTYTFKIPLILRLIEMVKTVYKNKVPFSKKSVLVRDGFTCSYCGSQEDITVDHIIPTSKGGKTSYTNCVACCLECNLKKGNKSMEEMGMKLKKVPSEPSVVEFMRLKLKNTNDYELLQEVGVY
jgi:5-methylcytosine-specific restriction endonuclease McrA